MPQETQDQPAKEEVQNEPADTQAPEDLEAPQDAAAAAEAVEEAQSPQAPAAEEPAEPAEPAPGPEAPAAEKPAEQAPAAEEPSEPGEEAAEAPAGEEAAEAAEKKDDLPEYAFETEDVGKLKKRVTITVPPERVEAKRNEMFGQLSDSAQVPGFRIGRAPRRLLEKRFGREVREDVRNALVGESLGQVEDKTQLKAIGEPDLKLDEIELPDSGPMVYSFEIEVVPEFDLPELEGIPVEKHTIEINEERIDQSLEEWRLGFAKYEAADDAAAANDTVAARVRITGEDIEPVQRDGQVLRVAQGQVEGLPLMDLGTELAGKKSGETATLTVDVPQAHPNEAWRGKKLTVELTVNEVRKRVLPELTDEFARSHGLESVKDLRETVGKSLTARVEQESLRLLRNQVRQYLLDQVELDVPAGAAERHTTSVLQRRYVDLLQQGVPRERIDESLTELQAAAGEQALRQLKLEFILSKIAEEKEFTVSDEEVNSRVTEMARQADRRPERLRQELDADGSLALVETMLRDEKVLDFLLDKAKIAEPAPEKAKPQKEPAKAKKKAKKKSAKAKARPPAAEEEAAPKAAAAEADKTEDKPPAEAKKKAKKKAAKKAE